MTAVPASVQTMGRGGGGGGAHRGGIRRSRGWAASPNVLQLVVYGHVACVSAAETPLLVYCSTKHFEGELWVPGPGHVFTRKL